ncbi:hypothetical protein [Pseudomonas sp. 273]|uniref:hypothetical protein n=1 Tax=Pseudomonas sp. 273 TaxID=75692 RepID=UPI0023D84E95|nr:hypothetical protein [Pseudomonas sp. 273]
MGVDGRVDRPQRRRQSIQQAEQAAVILARHHDVDVVVPGNEAAMAHSAQQRSADQVVVDGMGLEEVD